MTKGADEVAATSIRGGGAYRVLIALVVGLLAGAWAQSLGDGMREPALQVSGFVGGLWLNALKMTVIPLVVSLLVIGIAKGAEAARAGKIAGRTVMWIVIVCTASAIFGAVMIELLTGFSPCRPSRHRRCRPASRGWTSRRPPGRCRALPTSSKA